MSCNPVRFLARFLEGVDCITTCTGKIDQAMALYGHNPVAPLLAGVMTFIGGSFFRYFEHRGLLEQARYSKKDGNEDAMALAAGPPGKYVLAEWNPGLSTSIWYTCLYWYFGKIRNNGRDEQAVRLGVCTMYVFFDLLAEVMPAGWTPFAWPERIIASIVRTINTALSLGPPPTKHNRLLR